MKGKDTIYFIFWVILPLIGSTFYPAINVSDVITFLSIMVGFQVTSLSIIFNSKILNHLHNLPDPTYRTPLHRLSSYYKFAISFESVCVVGLLLLRNVSVIQLFHHSFEITKNSLIPSILFGTLFCMFKVAKDLFKIFELPRNE